VIVRDPNDIAADLYASLPVNKAEAARAIRILIKQRDQAQSACREVIAKLEPFTTEETHGFEQSFYKAAMRDTLAEARKGIQ
jgi:hypothetical protein